MARSSLWWRLVIAGACSAAISAAGFWVSYTAIDEDWVRRFNTGPLAGSAAGDDSVAVVMFILAQNFATLAFLYSGVITAGLTSVIGLGMVAGFVGATFKVGVLASGLTPLLLETGLYLPLEFGACLVAGAAGLYPLVCAVSRALDGAPGTVKVLRAYVGAATVSLAMLGVATALLLVGALVETLLIVRRF